MSFSPISAPAYASHADRSDKNLNPQNIQYIPKVKILIFLDLDGKKGRRGDRRIKLFSDELPAVEKYI